MRILICDDEEKSLNRLKAHINEYMNIHYIQADFYTTTSAKEAINSNLSFDLAFLDIQMPELDGITVAKELKKRNSKVILFFVTAFDRYQDDAMNLQIFRFFEKPFDVERLFSSLDTAMEYIDRSYIDVFINNSSECQRVIIDDIIYIMREGRKSVVVTKNGDIRTTKTDFERLCSDMPNTFFFLVHKSFFINLHYVTRYNYSEVYLNDTVRIAIAPRKRSDFHKYWYNYVNRR